MSFGSSILGTNLVDELTPVADELRELHVEFGTRNQDAYTVLRTWADKPTITHIDSYGTVGTTPYTYKATAVYSDGTESIACDAYACVGNATLDAYNYNIINVSYLPYPPDTINVFRISGGTTQGKIGTIAYPNVIFQDTGLIGDSKAPNIIVPRRGTGLANDTVNPILPRPEIKTPKPNNRYYAHPAGKDEDGNIELKEVSLSYTENELKGPTLADNQSWMIKTKETLGTLIKTRYYILSKPPIIDREETIGWIIDLKRETGHTDL